DPARLARDSTADGQMQIVQQIALELRGLYVAAAPLRVRIPGSIPHRARIWPALDEERAARLRDVLARHVHREHVAHVLRLFGMIRQPPAAAADLGEPDEGERPRRRRNLS